MFWTRAFFNTEYYTVISAWPHVHSFVHVFCIRVWLPKSCCVSAGVRGSPQSGAEGLRRWLDHRHQPPGGNPHLSAVGCATLEGNHTQKQIFRYFSTYSVQKLINSVCDSQLYTGQMSARDPVDERQLEVGERRQGSKLS